MKTFGFVVPIYRMITKANWIYKRIVSALSKKPVLSLAAVSQVVPGRAGFSPLQLV
jgi:hypothetical protein